MLHPCIQVVGLEPTTMILETIVLPIKLYLKMPTEGLEPTCLKAADFKSTTSTIPSHRLKKVILVKTPISLTKAKWSKEYFTEK